MEITYKNCLVMDIKETELNGCFLIKPKIYEDSRGLFFETYRSNIFNELIDKNIKFVQHSHSRSDQGVLRGLHYQKNNPQGKLVRVISGEVFDVAVDIRKNSKNYGRWIGFNLSHKNCHQLWIPPGFAHGFCVLSKSADISYRLTDYFDKDDSFSLNCNDPDINIKWPIEKPLLSDKDKNAPFLRDIKN